MKLLFITSRFPYPLEKGDKLRSYFLLKELAKSHEIILVSLSDEHVKENEIQHIRRFVSEVHIFQLGLFARWFSAFLFVFSSLPIQTGYFFNRKADKFIRKLIQNKQPKHIFCQLLRTALYVENVKDIPKTLDYQDVLSHGVKRRMDKSKNIFMKIVFSIEYRRLKKFEHRIFDWFDNKTIISETDKAFIPHEKKDDIKVVRNGVDFDFFSFSRFALTNKKYDIVFTGNMGYPPNIDCAVYIIKYVLPKLLPDFPQIQLVVAGANPPRFLKKMGGKNVTITGWVDDMRDYYSKSKVFLAPMQIGTGLQNKLLEAMAMKLPCVTTSLANDAIGTINGRDILVGNNSDEIATCVRNLLLSTEFASQVAENGYQFVKQHFSWEYHGNILNELICSK